MPIELGHGHTGVIMTRQADESRPLAMSDGRGHLTKAQTKPPTSAYDPAEHRLKV
jgi:hypothetical protein